MENQQLIKIFNGKIITPAKIIAGGTIPVTGKTITTVSEKNMDV